MKMEKPGNKYTRAAKRVKELKDFYRHVIVFAVVNGALYLIKSGVLQSFLPNGFPKEAYYYNWIDAHLVIWAIILAIHAAFLFRHKLTFLNKWEERQIQKYMEKEEGETKKYN